MADVLRDWPPGTDAAVELVLEAEALCELSTGVIGRLDDLGADGRIMASAIGRAADELAGFTIAIDSPLAVSAAVASVKDWSGSDNDPESKTKIGTKPERD